MVALNKNKLCCHLCRHLCCHGVMFHLITLTNHLCLLLPLLWWHEHWYDLWWVRWENRWNCKVPHLKILSAGSLAHACPTLVLVQGRHREQGDRWGNWLALALVLHYRKKRKLADLNKKRKFVTSITNILRKSSAGPAAESTLSTGLVCLVRRVGEEESRMLKSKFSCQFMTQIREMYQAQHHAQTFSWFSSWFPLSSVQSESEATLS